MGRDLHLPDDPPIAAAVVLHPHPSMGGNRHHPLVASVADGLAGVGVAALRVDLVDPDPRPAAALLEAIADDLLATTSTDRLVLVGYSWGSVVSLLARPDAVVARALVAPPVSMLGAADEDGTPTLVQVPAHDQFGPPDAVRDALGGWPATEIEVVKGCDHFLVGAIAPIADRVVGWTRSVLA
jgi:alpha/beta superfamily hydrolase